MSLFSFEDLNKKDNTTDASLIEKYESVHLKKIKSIKDLCGEIPNVGEIYFLWTLNSFNAFTFIVYAIKHVGIIDNLIISTYSINERILASICKWYDKGLIKEITICISDSIQTRNSRVNDLMKLQAAGRNFTIKYAWNHSKVMLIHSKDNFLTIEGSGNLSENARFEQYIFTNNKKVYEFRKECIINNSL